MAVLTVGDHIDAPQRAIPREQWRFARLEGGRAVADPTHIFLGTGFEPGKLYELVYAAQGAPIVGLGLLAVRDVVTWLRYADTAAGNPCAGTTLHAYGFGVSQSSHLLRHLLYLGLNEDEEERTVFDGVLAVTGSARRGEFNMRFGQPAKTLGQYVGALFPFSEAAQTDPETGRADGLMARLVASGKVPRLFVVDS